MQDDNSTERLRLFVAITVPERVRAEMLRIQQELRGGVGPAAVRWTRPEQFHLTLRFLGNVAAARAAGLAEVLAPVCSSTSSLRLRAQGVGFFPNARSPRVLWAGVTDEEGRLPDLHRRLERAIQAFADGPRTAAFAGHVTLGRVRHLRRGEMQVLSAHAQSVRDRWLGEWVAGEIEILRSELSPAGALYTTVAKCPLTAV